MTCFRPGRWVTSYGENMPQNLAKSVVNRQQKVKPKTAKSIYHNISGTINPTNYRFEDQVQTMKGTSWVVRHYSKAKTTWLTAAILKIDMRSYFRNGCSDLDKIRHPDAEYDADYGEMVKIEIRSRVPKWRTFGFKKRK